MRIAVIADIHGNLPAIEAVLADIERRGADRTINLGDCVSGPMWPREVCDLIMDRDDLTICGKHDRWVSGPDPTRMGASERYAHSQLNADHRVWLAALPTSVSADHGILACHGTPIHDNRYLIEDASGGRLVRASPATIRERLGDVQARVVLCGHSHQQHFIQLPDGPTIVNPGSVGCPSYDDPGNEPHVSESGSPHARYAVLDINEDRVSAEMIEEVLVPLRDDCHADESNRSRDRRGKNALIFRPFWYWGGLGIPSPDGIAALAHYHVGQATRNSSPEKIAEVEEWARDRWPIRVCTVNPATRLEAFLNAMRAPVGGGHLKLSARRKVAVRWFNVAACNGGAVPWPSSPSP